MRLLLIFAAFPKNAAPPKKAAAPTATPVPTAKVVFKTPSAVFLASSFSSG